MVKLITALEDEPLQIIAHLSQGIVQDPHQGISLEGILTSVTRDINIGEQKLEAGSLLDGGTRISDPVTVDIPLARCVTDEQRWHWASTFAYPLGIVSDAVTHTVNIAKHHVIERTVNRMPSTLSNSSGRYKSKKMPVPQTLTNKLYWNTVGNKQQIEHLLSYVTHIGGRRNMGEGNVIGWSVDPIQTTDLLQHSHLIEQNMLGRHSFIECVNQLNPQHYGSHTRTGYRPPYWHPSRQYNMVTCVNLDTYLSLSKNSTDKR